MTFNVNTTQEVNKGHIVLYDDGSYTIVDGEGWNFQVSIEPYPVLMLNIDYRSKHCVGVEGALFLGKKTIKRNISIDNYVVGKLFIEDIEVDEDSYGTQYFLQNSKEYYDENQRIFAIGDIDANTTLWKLCDGFYIKIIDNTLIALFISF